MSYPEGIRPGALVRIQALSIYTDHTAPLPERMAWLTPDAADGLVALQAALHAEGGEMYLSDAFRSEMAQACARYDYLKGIGRTGDLEALITMYPRLRDYTACNGGRGKRAFSPPPGGSVHEAGRAIDVDLDPRYLGISQTRFAEIAYDIGWNNIVGGVQGMGNPYRVDVREEWHWEFRGHFQSVYEGALARTGQRDVAYREMAASMIRALKE